MSDAVPNAMPNQWAVSWQHRDLGIPELWRKGIKGDGVTVALLDTGLAAPKGLDRTSFEYLDARGNRIDPSDLDGHGTCCASVIASYRTGAMGIAPFAKIVSLRVLETGSSMADVEAALTYVSKRPDIDVVSCSFVMSACSPAIQGLVAALAKAGKIVVAAAGDIEADASAFPENVPGLVTVAAIDSGHHPLPGARLGNWIDVAAPGSDLPVVLRGTNATGLFGQSSAAAAVTSGVVALALSSQPAARRSAVGRAISLLLRTKVKPLPAGDPTGNGHGVIDPAGIVAGASAVANA
jgi:subtilisin family serine protease